MNKNDYKLNNISNFKAELVQVVWIIYKKNGTKLKLNPLTAGFIPSYKKNLILSRLYI